MVRVLIAYGTLRGSTRRAADTIAEALRSEGLEADVRAAAEVGDLSGYDAAIVGGGMYGSRWHADALGFIQRHRTALDAMPVACFARGTSLIRGEQDVERRRATLSAQIDGRADPVGIAFFPDSTSNLPLMTRILSRLAGRPPCDYRARDAIDRWARDIAHELAGSACIAKTAPK